MNYTYMTLLSTDNYLNGVLVLNESLISVHSKYKLTVLVTSQVSEEIVDVLKKYDIDIIRKNTSLGPSKVIQEQNKQVGYHYWNNTFDCLIAFELTEFDKIIFLDSDMLVIENIDELFDKPHMSAVKDLGTSVLNSGTMVIVPQEGLLEKILTVMPEVEKEKYYFGDQTVLQYYYKDWASREELHLDEKYNMFIGALHWFIGVEGYHLKGNTKNICIIHFVGVKKPWMLTDQELSERYVAYKRDGNPYAIQMTKLYLDTLRKVISK